MTETIYPAWRQRLASSLLVNRSQVHSQYFQVASACSNGRPKNRTMVFRGFLEGTQNLLSVTDLRSEKSVQWQGDDKSRFEICWYFSNSREQFRLAGEVALISNSLNSSYAEPVLGEHTKESLLKRQWSNLSTKATKPFYSNCPKAPFDEDVIPPSAPAAFLTQSDSSHHGFDSGSGAQDNLDVGPAQISENFCVVVFIPDAVDYLNLKSKPQQRCLYDIQDGWKERQVNP